jgi:hypothetical protein
VLILICSHNFERNMMVMLVLCKSVVYECLSLVCHV